MNKRPAYPARGWLYCAATSLLLMGPTMLHAQAKDAADSTAKPAATKTARKTQKGNPLFRAVKRELSKLQGKKTTTRKKTAKTTKQKTSKSKPGLWPIFSNSKSKTAATPKKKSSARPVFNAFRRSKTSTASGRTRQPIRQVAGDQPIPSLDKIPSTTTTRRARKPGLLDRLLGHNKRRTRPRRITTQQNVQKKSNGIPGLLPSFLRRKSKEQATAKRLPTQQRTASNQPVVNQVAAPVPKLDDLDNPFPELTEAEADTEEGNPTAELTETTPEPKEENPFTGIKLDDPTDSPEPVVQSASGTSEEAPVLNTNSAPPLPLDTAEEPKSKPEENPHQDKLKRLAEREAMGGLKGFCPVVLRDSRDLVDADPQITSSYEGKTYSFSTIEAKESFDAEPAKYAPIHSGHDVIVLTEGNVELEGTLENAVWFKDRLYLFSSEATLETFIGDPAQYATHAPEASEKDDTDTVGDADPFDDTESQDNTDPFEDMDAELPAFTDEASADDDE